MIDPKCFLEILQAHDIEFYAGVPDSLLKEFCACIDDNGTAGKHIIAANEGNAVAVASGYHMATGKVAAVYMQNSGLGNTINPLTSLADPEVYRIPMLLIIGWRGEPGVKDEPQHVKQGRITIGQLDLLEIPYHIIDSESNFETIVTQAHQQLKENNAPVALLVRKDAFSNYKSNLPSIRTSTFKREEALRVLLELAGDAPVVSTTGKTSREVFELRGERQEAQRDFLTVGAMGHTLSIALGVAMGQPDKRIVCLDGDGSVLMHLGALPIMASAKPDNLVHVLLNNAAHESVGGQPTVADQVDFKALALACGYQGYAQAHDIESLKVAWSSVTHQSGPVLLEIKIATGARENLGRPSSPPSENKNAFMKWVAK